jgi:leader peptidase (prepilin peptidase)/N-methyltransferase
MNAAAQDALQHASPSVGVALGEAMPLTLGVASYEIYIFLVQLVILAWVFAFGSCIGSLVNVLVYRLPLGLDVVSVPSRCSSCETRLTWRENIPVLGWIMLRGRCRFCHAKVSSEYPIVEAIVGLLWVLVYLVLYADQGRFLGIRFGALQPEWAFEGFRATWPQFIIIVTLVSCLVAMTIVDAKTFQIPLVLTWVPAAIGVLFHTGHALWVEYGTAFGRLMSVASGWNWTIPTPLASGWGMIGTALGGTLGLGISILLLHLGLLRRSFADYDAWEAQALAKAEAEKSAKAEADALQRAASGTPAPQAPSPEPEGEYVPSPDMWTQYPHARRETVLEMAFLAPPAILAYAGSGLATWLTGPHSFDPVSERVVAAVPAPLWLCVLAGALLGYLVGGGVVWAMRIFGAMAFNKEAMGLGDVHLMAAVGACIGWIDAVLGFFAAAFVGVGWAILSMLGSGRFQRAMPFGPFLAVGAMLVWFFKPVAEALLSRILHQPLNLP